jgi:hypothetical protein
MTKDQLYEEEKSKLDDLPPEEYEQKIKEICEKLNY